MTKRVIISVLLLLIALSLSISSFFFLRNRISALGEALENAVYTDLPLPQTVKQIEKEWENSVTVFHLFLLHSDVSQLQTQVQSLPDLISQPETLRLTCIRSLYLLRGIEDGLSLSVENII